MKIVEIINEVLDDDDIQYDLRAAAREWLENHPDVYAELSHFHNDGDVQREAETLERHITDHDLLWAVIDEIGF